MELKFEKLSLKNFLSYGAKVQEFSFEPGLHLITGLDKGTGKKNGAGKSVVFEAIFFALFGRSIRDVNKAGLVNMRNKKNCVVDISFWKGEDHYRISRGLLPNFIKLFKNGVEVEQSAKKRDFQEQIEQDVLELDYATFVSLVHSNPNTSISLFNTPKAEKRRFIEALFGLETFSKINESANAKLKEAEATIHDIKNDIASKKDFINNLRVQNERFETDLKTVHYMDVEAIKADCDRVAQEQQDISKKIEEIDSFIKKVEGIISEIDQASRKFEVALATLNQHHRSTQVESVSFDESLFIRKKEERRELQAKIDPKKVEQNKQLIVVKTTSLTKNVEEANKLKQTIASLQGEKKSIPSVDLKGEVNCPTCHQLVDFDEVSEKYNSMRATLDKEIEKHSNTLELCEGINAGFRSEISVLEEEIQEQERFAKKLEELDRQIEKLEADREKAAKVEKARRIKSALSHGIDVIGAKVKSFEVKKQEKQKVIRAAEEKKSGYESRKVDVLGKYNDIGLAENHNEHEAKREQQIKDYIAENTTKIEEYETSIAEQEEKKSLSQKIVDYMEYIKVLCKDENVKQFAIGSIVPVLNGLLNNYLAEIGFNMNIKLDSWLNLEEITGPGIRNGSYGNLSGGEGKAADLSMQMSLLDIAKAYSTVFPNILLLDEIADCALDQPSLEKIFNLIKIKQAKDNSCVYLISHRTELSSMEFDKQFLVTKSEGFSTINEAEA